MVMLSGGRREYMVFYLDAAVSLGTILMVLLVSR